MRNIALVMQRDLDMLVMQRGSDMLIKLTSLILSIKYSPRYLYCTLFIFYFNVVHCCVLLILNLKVIDGLQIFEDETSHFAPDIQVNLFASDHQYAYQNATNSKLNN